MPKTKLIYQAAEHQNTTRHETNVQSIQSYKELQESIQSLFKAQNDEAHTIHAIVTKSTIFHAQGGGQPSDQGTLVLKCSTDHEFTVLMARMLDGVVYHFGSFVEDNVPLEELGDAQVEQHVDEKKRCLFSRLHTAGHVLGTATRTLLESQIPNFDELKASHFPDSAACEFQGLIDGKYKTDIQQAVDRLVAEDRDVRIEWWTKGDFKNHNLSRLLPDDKTWAEIATAVDEKGTDLEMSADGDHERTRIRVVNIVGAEVYPCGGTHCGSTKPCGPVKVKKISRTKGNSRISYQVE